jgi:hypothetical protein
VEDGKHEWGWDQVETRDLKPGDVVIVFNDRFGHPHPEFSYKGYVLWGEKVKDVTWDSEHQCWFVRGPIIPRDKVLREFSGLKSFEFCGDGKGNYQGVGRVPLMRARLTGVSVA